MGSPPYTWLVGSWRKRLRPVRTLSQPHDVVVIPSSSALAPRKLTWSGLSQPSFVIDAGSPITGVVRHGTTAVAGAKVELSIDGVPSTIGTTAADGSFSLRGVPVPSATVTVEVTPPASLGLPRLEAAAAFDLSQPVAITYSSTLLTRSGLVPRSSATQPSGFFTAPPTQSFPCQTHATWQRRLRALEIQTSGIPNTPMAVTSLCLPPFLILTCSAG